MDPITLGLLIGGGGGLVKSELFDRPKENRQRKLAAQTQAYSPWTGLKADKIQEADPMGQAMQFGTTGAMLGSGIQRQQNDLELQDAMKGYYNRGGWGSVANNNVGMAYDTPMGGGYGGADLDKLWPYRP